MTLGQFYNIWLSPQRWLDRMGMRPPMQIVVGLVLLMICVLKIAQTLQLVPNQDAALLRSRTILADLASSRVASQVANDDFKGARNFLQTVVRNHDDVLSASLRRLDGTIAFETPGHEQNWAGAVPNESTPTHIQVVLYVDKTPWGRLEIAFHPLHPRTSWRDWVFGPDARLGAFIIGGSFLLFWFFLSRMLRMLDPSAAVPERMQLMIDTLVEGLVIVDNDDQILMANQAFEQLAFLSRERLIGRALTSLPWLAHDGPGTPEVLPWRSVLQSNLPQRSVSLRLQIGTRHNRRLNVNASPILDPNGARRGIVVTFDDQTLVESDNLKLAKLIAKFSEASGDLHEFRERLKSVADFDHLDKLEELAAAAREMAGTCDSAGEKPPQLTAGNQHAGDQHVPT